MNTILMPIVEKAHETVDFIVGEIKVGYQAVKDVIKTGAHAMLVAAAQSTFGTTMANLVEMLWSHDATGNEKMDALVAAAIPFAEKVLAGLSWTGIFSKVADFVRAVAQMMFPTIANRMRELAAGH